MKVIRKNKIQKPNKIIKHMGEVRTSDSMKGPDNYDDNDDDNYNDNYNDNYIHDVDPMVVDSNENTVVHDKSDNNDININNNNNNTTSSTSGTSGTSGTSSTSGSGGNPFAKSQFRNPWDGSTSSIDNDENERETHSQSQRQRQSQSQSQRQKENESSYKENSSNTLTSFLTQEQKEDLQNHMQRRKSSLIVPPTRAAGPDIYMTHGMTSDMNDTMNYTPSDANANNENRSELSGYSGYYGYNNYNDQDYDTDATTLNNTINNSKQSGFTDPGFNKQFSFNRNERGNGGRGMGMGMGMGMNRNEFMRRQSVASGYTNNPMSGVTRIGNNNNTSGNNTSTNNTSSNTSSNINPMNLNMTALNTHPGQRDDRQRSRKFSLQYTTSPNRHNAHPQTAPSLLNNNFNQQMQPPYKQMRRDSLPSPTQPHMQLPQSPTQQQYITPVASVPSLKPVEEMKPFVNQTPLYRRASHTSKTISPLNALTMSLTTTYSVCSPYFQYQTSKNPKRVLTKPSEPVHYSTPWDNVNSDYILYVNDILGDGSHGRKFLILDLLGQGTFGQVVKAQNLDTQEFVAVKIVKSKPEYLNPSFMECKILQILQPYKGFLQLKDSFIHKGHLCLVFELLGQNLFELLKQNKFHGLHMVLINIFGKQLLDALMTLKDLHLIHCDLKPENILLESSDKPNLRIVDFGSACEENHTIYTYIQSRFYRAPEVMLGLPYSSGIDMWSFGCVVAELFLGIPIFPGSSEFNQLSRIVEFVGYPPNWMLDKGKNTKKYFKLNPQYENGGGDGRKYQLKTLQQYNKDLQDSAELMVKQGFKKPAIKLEEEGKKYFEFTSLNDLITHHRLNKVPKEYLEKNVAERQCLLHFLQGCFNLNPLQRYTPQQALMHPFITKQSFKGDWYPPGVGGASSASSASGLANMRNSSAATGLDKLHLTLQDEVH